MVSLQIIIIQIMGLNLIAITMLVKSDCKTDVFTLRKYNIPYNRPSRRIYMSNKKSYSRPSLLYIPISIPFMDCEHMKIGEEPLFPLLLNYYENISLVHSYSSFKINETLLSTVLNITLVNSDVSLNSKTFLNFTSLMTLNLISNNLSTFDITPIPSLKNLDLSHNFITSLNNTNFQNFNLSSLNVSHNHLSSIYCLNVSTEIILSHNQLNDSCKFASTIKFINLSDNNLTLISETDFKNLNNLVKLDLSYNYIDYVNTELDDLKELQYIDLSNNNIKNIYHYCFKRLDSLISLNLSYNQIEQIHYGVTYNFANLRYLDLSYNDIYELDVAVVFYPIRNLKELYVVGNFLKDLDVNTLVDLLKQLEHISLSFSQISCNKLLHYLQDLHKNEIKVLRGPVIYEHNVHGILCTPINKTSSFENNFEYAANSVEKVYSLFIAVTVLLILILPMLFVVNYFRYKIRR